MLSPCTRPHLNRIHQGGAEAATWETTRPDVSQGPARSTVPYTWRWRVPSSLAWAEWECSSPTSPGRGSNSGRGRYEPLDGPPVSPQQPGMPPTSEKGGPPVPSRGHPLASVICVKYKMTIITPNGGRLLHSLRKGSLHPHSIQTRASPQQS